MSWKLWLMNLKRKVRIRGDLKYKDSTFIEDLYTQLFNLQ